LILIPKLDLLDGWLTKISNFLQIPGSEVGVFSGGVHQIGNTITVAHTGEVMRHWRKLWDRIGFLIVDECQRCPSKVLTYLIPNFDCRYMLGLSNTAQRKDRLSRLVYYHLGDVVYSINEKDAREGRGIIHAHVVARPTPFEYPYHSRSDYQPMLEALARDEGRTRLIADDIESELREVPQPLLVLTTETVGQGALEAELGKRGIPVMPLKVESLAGEEDVEEPPLPNACLENVEWPTGPVAVLVTPNTLAQCSANLKARVLFLAVPIYFRKHLANALRNLYVNGNDQKLKIYDYVDHRISLLENYFRMRSYNYGVHPDVLLNSGPL